MKYETAVENLIEGIKEDYAKWSNWPEGVERFNAGVRVKSGNKYDKVIHGSSVWGFIAKADGVLKGIPFKKGDVFKAAGWAAPAKHVRYSFCNKNDMLFLTDPRCVGWAGGYLYMR